MKTLFVLASVMVVLFLAAPNRIEAQKRKAVIPVESTANAYLRNRVTTESRGALSLAGFRKTNGYERGYGVYVIEWQAEILFQQEGYKAGDFFMGSWQDFRVLQRQPGTLDSLVVGNTKHFNKGTTIRLTGDATMRKTEQGWRLEGLSVKTSQVIAGPIINGPSQGTSPLYVAHDGEFSYSPPDAWVLRDVPGGKYKSAFGQQSEDFAPNINIVSESFSGTLDDYVAGNLRVLPSRYEKMGIKNFRTLSQSEFLTNHKQKGVKVITELEVNGIRYGQTFYTFEAKNGKKFVATCTVLAKGGESYDKIFDRSMKTFQTAASEKSTVTTSQVLAESAQQPTPTPAPATQPAAPHTNLKVGQAAPDFTLPSTIVGADGRGVRYKLSDFKTKKNVVLAFYVLAFTGG